jgi:hypothetical protein
MKWQEKTRMTGKHENEASRRPLPKPLPVKEGARGLMLKAGRLLLSNLHERAERCAYELLGSGAGCAFWPTAEKVVAILRERLAQTDEEK